MSERRDDDGCAVVGCLVFFGAILFAGYLTSGGLGGPLVLILALVVGLFIAHLITTFFD